MRIASLALTLTVAANVFAASVPVAMTPERFRLIGSNLKSETFLGRRSLFLEKGMAIAEGIAMQDGTIEFDMATAKGMRFLGVMFRLQSQDEFESIFFRPGASGTLQAIQYQPNLLGSGTWQVFNGEDANAVADLPRDRWIHVKVEIDGAVARVFLNKEEKPVLTVPRLILGQKSGSIGFWTGPFGNGGYFSNLTYTAAERPAPIAVERRFAPASIIEWQISNAIDAGDPSRLPDLDRLEWQSVRAEPWESFGDDALPLVLLNRYRRGPNVSPPEDPRVTMSGRGPGAKVVYARAFIDSDRDQFRRMHFGYSDGVVVFANGQPLFFGANPFPLRDLGGVMERVGEAVYLPLKKGRNEIVLAVSEYFGGWAYWARLDP